MELVRCLVGAGTLATMALVATVGAVRPPVLAATDPPWQPTPCGEARAGDVPIGGGGRAGLVQAGPAPGRARLADRAAVDGRAGGRAGATPGPGAGVVRVGARGGLVLVGDDDGAESRLRLLDVARGCETAVDREAEAVIRGALLAPDGSAVWEHRVNRVTRADEGIWRRPVAGDPPSASSRVCRRTAGSGRRSSRSSRGRRMVGSASHPAGNGPAGRG